MTVTFWLPPVCSQVPVHWFAVSGPQPAVRGRNPLPLPLNCGPVVVVPLPGPTLGAPPAPVAPPGPTLPSGPPLVPVPHTPFVQAPLAHSSGERQLVPSGKSEPSAHFPRLQVPLAHWSLVLQEAPAGTPWPLPVHVPPWHTPLTQSVSVVHVPPPGWPLLQAPFMHSPPAQEALLVHAPPPGTVPSLVPRLAESDEPHE